MNPMDINRGMDQAVKIVLDDLAAQAGSPRQEGRRGIPSGARDRPGAGRPPESPGGPAKTAPHNDHGQCDV